MIFPPMYFTEYLKWVKDINLEPNCLKRKEKMFIGNKRGKGSGIKKKTKTNV